jgi:hypothetical protein
LEHPSKNRKAITIALKPHKYYHNRFPRDENPSKASNVLVQVPVEPVTRERNKKFKDVLDEIIHEIWAQAHSWRPIEDDPLSRRIRSRDIFGTILEESDCMAILKAKSFPFMVF